MSVYQSIKDLGKNVLLAGGLAAILSGCEEEAKINQVFADVNNDGKNDIIDYQYNPSVGCTGSHGIYVSLNFNGIPRFKKVLDLKTKPIELYVKDLDGDSIPDISYVIRVGWRGSWDMYSAKGKGDGTFQKPIKIRHYKNRP